MPNAILTPANGSTGIARPLVVTGTIGLCASPQIRITFFDAGGTFVGGPTTSNLTVDANGNWTFTENNVPATATKTKIELLCAGAVAQTVNGSFDNTPGNG